MAVLFSLFVSFTLTPMLAAQWLKDESDPELCWTIPADPHWELRVVNVADGSYEDLDGGTYAFRPTWDPSQPWRIVSDGGRGLLAVSVAGDDQTKITENVGMARLCSRRMAAIWRLWPAAAAVDTRSIG